MSKKLLFSVFLLFIFSVSLFAEGMNFNFWGGPTKVKMKKINDTLQSTKDSDDLFLATDNTYTGSTDIKKIENAFILGMDGMKDINEKISVGGRVSYLTTNEGKISWNETYKDPDYTNNYTESFKINASLLSLMIGGKYTEKINDKLSLNGKLFLGYGIAKYKAESEFKQTDSNGRIDNYPKDSYSKTKGCFVSDLTVGAEYSFTEKLALGLDLGYRFASKPKISDDIELDFSGLTSALSLNYKF